MTTTEAAGVPGRAAAWRGPLDDEPRPRLLGYVRPLDGLRGVAVLTVVAFHAAYLTTTWVKNPLPGGFLGVDVFFAISGFLITAGLIDELQSRRSLAYGNFWERRLRRLYPALLGLVIVLVIVLVVTGWRLLWLGHFSPFVPLSNGQAAWAIAGTVAYVSNWMQAWHLAYPFSLSHTWSLAVEMQFYLVWPLVVIAAVRWRWRRSALVAVVLAGVAAAAADRALSWTGPSSALGLYVRTDTRADVILLGCAGGLAFTWRWVGPRVRTALRPLSIAAAAGLVVLFVVAREDAAWMFRIGFFAVAVCSALVVVAVTVEPRGLVGRLLGVAPLVWLGKRSYSLYLWHLPVFIAFAAHSSWHPWPRLIAALVCTVLFSEVSYRFVERPLRARPRRLQVEQRQGRTGSAKPV